MSSTSQRLSVSPVGYVVAQSVLHPLSAHQLIEFAAARAVDLIKLAETDEPLFQYVLLHAAYSSNEYENRGHGRNLPYQLEPLVANPEAERADQYLIERPWRRNAKAANAAMVAMRWVRGAPRDELSNEFSMIGSGVTQSMLREACEILFAWSDCIMACAAAHLLDDDRLPTLRSKPTLLTALRNFASIIRIHARQVAVGLPPMAVWLASLTDETTGRPLLRRNAMLALAEKNLVEPVKLLTREAYGPIAQVFKELNIADGDNETKKLRSAVQSYRRSTRSSLWSAALRRSNAETHPLVERVVEARGKAFETCIEKLLDKTGIAYERKDDGKTPGAADLHIGLNHKVQVVLEMKTAEGDGMIGLNEATDVIKGAAIIDLGYLPKVTLANPGFDPNVPWQARKVKDVAFVEAAQFVFALAMLSTREIDKDTFLDWLAQPGTASVTQLKGGRAPLDH